MLMCRSGKSCRKDTRGKLEFRFGFESKFENFASSGCFVLFFALFRKCLARKFSIDSNKVTGKWPAVKRQS